MKVERLVVAFNNYDFDHDNVKAKSFGGTVSFHSHLGKMDVLLSKQTVDAIIELCAEDISTAAMQMARAITPNAIRQQAHGNLLEHQQEIFVKPVAYPTPVYVAPDDEGMPF